ncbi:hypothetical protein EMIT0180MI3_10060 [Priestia megaterium]
MCNAIKKDRSEHGEKNSVMSAFSYVVPYANKCCQYSESQFYTARKPMGI